MEREPIPDDVSRFVLLSIPSVPYLEAMLLFRREKAEPWDAKRLAERIYVSEKVARALLSDLLASGVLAAADPVASQYIYQPQSEPLGKMIDRLAECYSKNLVDITNLIHSKTSKKAQQFADAFLWRKDS